MADERFAIPLRDKRRELEEKLARLTDVPRDPTAQVSFGKRIGEGTTEAVERINVTAAARAIATTLDQVDRALARVAEGTYGACESCGARIPDERLEAVPWTARCVRCAARA